MFANELTTATLAVLLVLSAAVPAAAAGGTAGLDDEVSQSITVTIATTEDGTLVTFEQAGEAYADATVDVETVGGASYAGSGSYETDADGSIFLPSPEGEVAVRIDVATDDAHASGVVTLSAYEGVETETTVTLEVEAAGRASADGEADGAEETEGTEDAESESDGGADADASGSADAGASAEASADANGDGRVSLGERLSSFVRGFASVEIGGIGDAVADFALGNNPSDADDGARAGADVEAGAGASAGVEAGNGSASASVEDGSVAVEADGGTAGVSVSGSADGSASGDAATDGDDGAERSDESSVEAGGRASASGSSGVGSAEAGTSGGVEASGSSFLDLFALP